MKFSIVTPAWNSEKYLQQALDSVAAQEGPFDIEHIIVDGASTDRTVEIARAYQAKAESGALEIKARSLTVSVISEKDEGMYDAINKGFAKATGEIFAWINADDMYEPGAFKAIARALSDFPEIDWIKGKTATADESGAVVIPGSCRYYRRDWIQAGIYGQESYFIEQDSVFWRAGLWKRAGGVPLGLRRAGDYALWIKFSKFAELRSLDIDISRFRKRPGQLSKDVSAYKAEQRSVRPRRSLMAWAVRFFFSPQSRLIYRFPALEPIFLFLYPILFAMRGATYIKIVGNQASLAPFKSYRTY